MICADIMFEFVAELVYCGQKLQDDKVLNDYSVQPGATVHAIKKTMSEEQIQIPGIFWIILLNVN